jgi:hypothetical protein
MSTNHITNWLPIVQKTVESLDFGVIQIVVHGSKVVQIERTEKIRFDSETNKNRISARKEEVER